MKKNLLFSLVFLFTALAANAQEWQTDLKTAENIAQKENKEIILVFQGSDWCAPCIKLDREIWSTDKFQDYASEHYVLLLADFPRKKKNQLSPEQQEKNKKLAATYNQQGFFPLVVVLNEKGKVLGKTGYKKTSPEEYIELLNSFKS
ncbi:MAG: thioredoxin family protein [Salegentibacter sp.]